MISAGAGKQYSHPVDVECPCCSHRFLVPLKTFSPGAELTCPDCSAGILIGSSTLHQLLQEIDNDLHTPNDLPIVLRPTGHCLTSCPETRS